MLYPITIWLWALLLAGPNIPAVQRDEPTALQTGRPGALIQGDTGFYAELAAKLQQRLEAAKPEKLYLHFDRGLFQPGETLWFNAWLRNAGDLKPAESSQILHVELLDPKGSVLQRKTIIARDGAAAGEFDFSEDLPGGLYRIKAYTNWMRNTGDAFERTITLQKVVLPNLNLKLQFERKAFGPGDVAIARFDAMDLENKPLADRKLSFEAQIQGAENIRGEAATNANGRAYIRFQLPRELISTDGLLNIQLEHQGRQEAISRAIPIVLNKIDLQFFPEGGDLVGGLPCRVAFKALNEFGKPADVEGELLDENGARLATFTSFHDGLGIFDFTPRAEGRYAVRLTRPVASAKTYPLPMVQAKGYRLHLSRQDASAAYAEVSATHPGQAFLTATSGDKIVFFKEITVGNTTRSVKIPTENLPAGIVRLTLFDHDRFEQAERLVFVNRDRGLNIEIRPDREQYLPRDKVRLDIRVRDHAGNPVAGAFSLTVADDKLLTFADDKQGHLLAALLLEQDVKGPVEEPNFYFDRDEPDAQQALDYLLMTQGWRRFSWREVLHNQPFAVSYPAEKAELSGKLLRANGNPWAKAAVKLHPEGPVQMTDAEGRFSFKYAELEKYTHIEYNHLHYPVYGYTQNIVLWEPGYVGTGIINQERQASSGTVLRGRVIDETGEALIGATVKILRGKEFVRGTITDYNGEYRTPLPPGKYNLEVSYTGFQTCKTTGIVIRERMLNTVDVSLAAGTMLTEVAIREFRAPVVEQDRTQGGQTLTSDQIRNLPTRSVNAIMATTAGMTSIDSGERLIAKEKKSDTANFWAGDAWGLAGKASRRSAHPATQRYVRAREFYVPQYDQQQPAAERDDFRPTIYWNPSVKTDRDGKAQVEFYASDAITNFRVTLEGVTPNGQAGRQEARFFVQKPVSIALKTPASVVSGDILRLQVALTNHTALPANGVLDVQAPAHFALANPIPETVSVAAGETKTVSVEYRVGQAASPEQTISARFRGAETFEDAFETKIATLNRGFPVKRVISGNGMQNMFNIRLNDPVSGSLSVKLTAYPNLLNDVLKGMERMLRQPSGCFEQVSSTTYPNLLVLDLMRQTQTVSPEVESRALALIEDGYKKLAAYECKDGGFDWWGRSPAHEGLTAYGIMEFKDMSKVFPVDQQIIHRSVQWLLGRRDGKGGWKRRDDWHGWHSDGVIGAYIAWAVAEAGYGAQFRAETDFACQKAIESGDPYQIALLANALALQNDPRLPSFIRLLLDKQDENGVWPGKTHSVMGGGGNNLKVETTALAVLALLKTGRAQDVSVSKAIDFLVKSKTEYGYGSTQSTVLALKALTEYAKTGNTAPSEGRIVVQIDGKKVAEQSYSAKSLNALVIGDLEQNFSENNANVEVFFENTDQAIPFDLEMEYATRLPLNARNSPLSFQTLLAQNETAVGNTVRLSAVLKNETGSALASPMVVLGIPAGLTLQPWQLKQLGEQKKWDFYELWDGFAVFHFESLAPNETRRIDLDLRADISGVFEAPASQAFLYYDNDQRVWSKPEVITIR